MSSLGDRHSGLLGGRLRTPQPVTVAVHPPVDPCLADQHTTWMLLNLLCRLEGVVTEVLVHGPEARLMARVCPHAPDGGRFPADLIDATGQLEAVPVRHGGVLEQADIELHVGPGPATPRGWRALGHGWTGRLSNAAIEAPESESALPHGPYLAACLAAGEVFRRVSLAGESNQPTDDVVLDAWGEDVEDAPLHVQGIEMDLGLAGAGAVGVVALHALWASDGLRGRAVVADSDALGIDTTNLNRCVLFDRRHLGQPKASTVAEIYGVGQLELQPIDGRYDRDHVADPPAVLASAVDTNRSRHDLQRAFVPGAAVGASTDELRAELLWTGPPGAGPCLACHNPPGPQVPDTVRRAEVAGMGSAELADLAGRADCTPQTLREWAAKGECGSISANALGVLLAEEERTPMFSVGFVSVCSGVLLAGALLRYAIEGTPTEGTSRKLQFWRPQAPSNGQSRTVLAEASCTVCRNEVHRTVWQRRRDALILARPPRSCRSTNR